MNGMSLKIILIESNQMNELKDILNLKIGACDCGDDVTIGEYLKQLLLTLWIEDEGFSGKRPFGNSGWRCDIYKPLIEHGLVKGTLDDCGYIDEMDDDKADKLINDVIISIFDDMK